MRADAVSPELAATVFERDRKALSNFLMCPVWINASGTLFVAGLPGRMVPVCPAVIIDHRQFGKCQGRIRIEHVKSAPRLGKRAEPDLAHLMSICEGHTEPGMRAGSVWVTTKANREGQRRYLETVNASTSSS